MGTFYSCSQQVTWVEQNIKGTTTEGKCTPKLGHGKKLIDQETLWRERYWLGRGVAIGRYAICGDLYKPPRGR